MDIPDLEACVKGLKADIDNLREEIKPVLTDACIPLDERWLFFVSLPNWLTETSSWVHHFECLKYHQGDKYRNPADDELYDSWSKGETRSTDSIIETYLECGEDLTGTITLEDVKSMQEECLAQNLGAICFDW